LVDLRSSANPRLKLGGRCAQASKSLTPQRPRARARPRARHGQCTRRARAAPLRPLDASLKIRHALTACTDVRGAGEGGAPDTAKSRTRRKSSVPSGGSRHRSKSGFVGWPRPARNGVWSPRAPLDAKPAAASSALTGRCAQSAHACEPERILEDEDGIIEKLNRGATKSGCTP
jgi:hypothetical protein